MPADSNETLRQIMSGFSTMQYNMGLLPMQQNQALAGSPMMQAPPPPQVPHPAEAAMIAMQRHNDMVQQTLMAAQVTRYQPPPSAPMPSVSSMSSFMGGGLAPSMGGMTSPFSMGAGGMAASSYIPRMPSVFNPFAPTLPQSHFASPAMRNMQMMQHGQSQMMGMIAGGGEAALGIGGSMLGGALGSAVGGPIGGFVGSWLGNKVGGAVSSMIFNPVTQDFQRGRQIQAMTSPYMVSGPSLNTATGQGMDPFAARQVASGVRHMGRDLDFERTGFNTQDTLKIMQSSAEAGLMTGANTPDQMVKKVKDIAKAVKAFAHLTGDPDFRDAIQSLGQMRDLGYMGLSSQLGAVANRAMFARQAGMSQSQMTATMMAGAEMAGTMGLAGATGANAAMSGAGAANIAASSGAVNDLQLSRAGGTRGLGQIASAGALSAMQNEMYLLAGSKIGAGGKIQLDMDAFRRAQGMGFNDVNKLAANNLQQMQAHGIFDWNTRKQELKDEIAQRLKPGEMQMMMLQQAKAFMGNVPGMTLGTAIQQTTGLSADQARSLEAMYTSRKYWDGMIQQARVAQRDQTDQERARRDQFRLPGVGESIRLGAARAWGGLSDFTSGPFRAVSERLDRVSEERDAQSYGQHIGRISDTDLAHDDQERSMMNMVGRTEEYRRAYRMGGGQNPMTATSRGDLAMFGLGSTLPGRAAMGAMGAMVDGRMANRIGSYFGLSATSSQNMAVSLASESYGTTRDWHPLASFGSVEEAEARNADVFNAGTSLAIGARLSGTERKASVARLGRGGQEKMNAALSNLMKRANELGARGPSGGGVGALVTGFAGMALSGNSATAIGAQDVRKAMLDAGIDPDSDPNLAAQLLDTAKNISQSDTKAAFAKTEDLSQRQGAINYFSPHDAVRQRVSERLSSAGLIHRDDEGKVFGYSADDKTLAKLGNVFAHHTDDEMAMAAALAAAASTDPHKATKGQAELNALSAKLGDKFDDVQATAKTIVANEGLGEALTNIGGEGQATGLGGRIGSARWAFGGMKAVGGDEALQQRLGAYSKQAASAKDPIEAAKGMTESELELLRKDNPELAAQVDAMRGNDAKAANAAWDNARKMEAPSALTERYGQREGAEIGALQKERDSLAAGEASPEEIAETQADSVKVFADAVVDFKDAVNKLSGHGEGAHLDDNIPHDISESLVSRFTHPT
jgi:hypothetical protein